LLHCLTANGVPAARASVLAHRPPVGYLFAAFLSYNPIASLLGPTPLTTLSVADRTRLTSHAFFPQPISPPFKARPRDRLVLLDRDVPAGGVRLLTRFACRRHGADPAGRSRGGRRPAARRVTDQGADQGFHGRDPWRSARP